MVVVFEIASCLNKLQASVVASSAAIFISRERWDKYVCSTSFHLCGQNLPQNQNQKPSQFLKIVTLNTSSPNGFHAQGKPLLKKRDLCRDDERNNAHIVVSINTHGATSHRNPDPDSEDKKDKKIIPLDADDIALLKTYGVGPYGTLIKNLETDLVSCVSRVEKLCGIKESDTGLAPPPSRWDLTADKQATQEEHPLQVARCTKIINPGTTDAQYVINVKQIAKFVVGLGQHVAPTDIEEGMRVGVDRTKL